MAATVYALGAACWIASLAFRLIVVPWAAERTATTGRSPDGFDAMNAWAGSLYVVHMAASYAAFAATRFAGPFNPPFLAHLYPGAVGAAMVVS
jgi:hypothetical protein